MADDDIAESWEDWEDSGELDKKIKTAVEVRKDHPKESSVATLVEDSSHTPYQPQVRILRREPDSPSAASSNVNKSGAVSRPTKSLEEREAAYAEARLRILGTASADDAAEQRAPRLVQQLDDIRISDNVVRQPQGPDGSPGFKQRMKKL